MNPRLLAVVLLRMVLGSAILSCGDPPAADAGTTDAGGSADAGRRPPRDSGVAIVGEGLPCAVASTLQANCWSCHGSTPSTGAPYSLISRADLLTEIANTTRGARSVGRMRGQMGRVMPPSGAPVPEPAIAEFERWLSMGAPAEQCSGADAGACVTCAELLTNIATCVGFGAGGMPNLCNPNAPSVFICAAQQCASECSVAPPGQMPPPCDPANSATCTACLQSKCMAAVQSCQ
jgi:hypothetical protein